MNLQGYSIYQIPTAALSHPQIGLYFIRFPVTSASNVCWFAHCGFFGSTNDPANNFRIAKPFVFRLHNSPYWDFELDCMTFYDQCDMCRGHSFLQSLTPQCFLEQQLVQTSLSLGWLMMIWEDAWVNLIEETPEESVFVPGKALWNQSALSSLPVHRRHMSKPSQCQSVWPRMAEHRSKYTESLAGL